MQSTTRILTTHAGALPRPDELRRLVLAKVTGEPYDAGQLDALRRNALDEVVERQLAIGIDSINDGEVGKFNFTYYVRDRLSGVATAPVSSEGPAARGITDRDQQKFAEYFIDKSGTFALGPAIWRGYCVAPLAYTGAAALAEDLALFREALAGKDVAEAYVPANTPGTIEHWLRNDRYKTQEEFVFAIAEAMRSEYEAIAAAGFLLQIDDPDLPDGWQMFPEMSVAEYRRYATLRVEALNHALRNIPREQIRLHVCWGSFHGPHQDDIPLRDIADIIFSVRASGYSIEASNPCHEHEWRVFEDVKLPEGAVLIPGVVGHCSDFIEHPELVAQRIERYAGLVGRENVIAGTDCGLAPRVGHAKIAWAKLESLTEGARIASRRLWAK